MNIQVLAVDKMVKKLISPRKKYGMVHGVKCRFPHLISSMYPSLKEKGALKCRQVIYMADLFLMVKQPFRSVFNLIGLFVLKLDPPVAFCVTIVN